MYFGNSNGKDLSRQGSQYIEGIAALACRMNDLNWLRNLVELNLRWKVISQRNLLLPRKIQMSHGEYIDCC